MGAAVGFVEFQSRLRVEVLFPGLGVKAVNMAQIIEHPAAFFRELGDEVNELASSV